jgi:hypothetical protein
MSQAPPPTPAGLPPRPDVDERPSKALFVAFLVATALAVVFGVFAVAMLLRGPTDLAASPPTPPSASPSVGPTPSPSPSPRPKVDGAFRFLGRAAGGDPVRWDPCQTITYAVNMRGADAPVRPDLRVALRRVTAATGIRFRAVGTSRESFISAYERMRYEGVIRKAELILIWVDHEDYERILRQLRDPRPSIAFAKTMQGLFADRDRYFGGIIVIDDDATSTRGFGHRYAHGSVLLHELGHIIGLDHVKDPDQLMYTGRHPDYGLTGFGDGDLEGLRRLGTDAGCLG